MKAAIDPLQDIDSLQQVILNQQRENEALQKENAHLKSQIHSYKKHLFQSKSERHELPGQVDLFPEQLLETLVRANQAPEDDPEHSTQVSIAINEKSARPVRLMNHYLALRLNTI